VVTHGAGSCPDSRARSKAVFFIGGRKEDPLHMNLATYAHNYVKLGWSIFPIEPNGKKPLVKWEKCQKERATEDQVKKWWAKYPNANIGIVTGTISDIIVIDIDSAKGQEEYTVKLGEFHNTISQKTGKPNARQLFFKHPKDRKYHNRARLFLDVDVRADGGYVVVPPSVHPNGTVYQWIINPVEMGLNDLLDLPEDIKTQLISKTDKKPDHIEGWVQEALMGVKEGQRNDVCTRLAGYYLRAFEGDKEQVEILLQSWNERNAPPMDWKEVRTVIESVAKREGRDAMGNEVGERIEKIQILEYPPPDDTRKYKVFLANHEGSVEMNVNELVMFSRFKLKFTELARKIPRNVKQFKWEVMINKALGEAEIIKMSVDETLIGLVLRMINAEVFFDGCAHKLEQVKNQIVVNDDTIYLKIETLLAMMLVEREKVNRKEVGKILRSLGFENDVVRFGSGTQRCWCRKFDKDWEQKYRT
jgi:hypothetical protein